MPEVEEGLEVNIEGGKEIVDPGKQEGTRKDPRVEQDKLGPETPRFKEIYGKLKETERKLAELETKQSKGSDNSELINEMRRHNQSLEETIKSMNLGKETKDEEGVVKSLEDKLVTLRDLKRQARERADFASETDIDETIADLRLDIREAKKAIGAKKNAPVVSDKISGMPPEEQEAYDEWIEANPWFIKDSKKRLAAISFEKKIVAEPEFKDSTKYEILEEVGKRVEEKFKPVEGKNSVEGRGASSSARISGSVKLSPSEVEVAKGLGVPLETYAKQKSLLKEKR